MKKICSVCLAMILSLSFFAGCSSAEEKSYVEDSKNLIGEATSVETSILVELVGRVSSNISSDGHKASLMSDITINSTSSPKAYHAEMYSRITVDDVVSKEDREIYVVPENDSYYKYEYISDTDEWEKYKMSIEDVLTLPTKTGIDIDWSTLTSKLEVSSESVEANDIDCTLYTGETNSSILQNFFGNKVFDSFMYSVEMLLTDTIPFDLYVSNETGYPVQLVFDFADSFIVSDMSFDTASVTVTYDNWNTVPEISIPKKVSVVAIEPVKNLYNSFYAWNLFLPYVNGNSSSSSSIGNPSGTFQSLWNTYQFRLDDYLSALPITYEDLSKLGYKLDTEKSDIIVDPNQIAENVSIYKGSDKIVCCLYNDTTSAQPITSCKIGSIDISTANNSSNSITLFLPGEIHLGVSRDSIYAAYGEPDSVTTSFAADLCTWSGDDEQHYLIAEISPKTQEVIRIELKNINIYGSK